MCVIKLCCSDILLFNTIPLTMLTHREVITSLKVSFFRSFIVIFLVGGDRGAGAPENRGREGYGRRERKGREAGVLRGREAGEKCETLFF